MLTTIFIDQLQIHAPIGWYDEEQSNKVTLFVSVKVKLNSTLLSDDINNTIDYGQLTEWILTLSSTPVKLLETFAENILNHIEQHSPNGLISIWVSVRKPQIQSRGVLAQAHGVEVEQSYPKTDSN